MSDHNPEEDALLRERVDYALEWVFACALLATALALVTFALQIEHLWGRITARRRQPATGSSPLPL